MRIELGPSRISYRFGTAEPELQTFLASELGRGDSYYDIGANVGFFSLIGAAAVGAEGSVAAFEPIPANAALLRRNASLNRFDHVDVIEAAVADQPGRAALDPGADDQSAALSANGSVSVDVVTIDAEVAAGRRPPNLVKIDVEGAELQTLRGAASTLERFRPIIVCEVHAVGPTLRDHPVPRYLADLGYSLEWLEKDAVEVPEYWAPHLVARPIRP